MNAKTGFIAFLIIVPFYAFYGLVIGGMASEERLGYYSTLILSMPLISLILASNGLLKSRGNSRVWAVLVFLMSLFALLALMLLAAIAQQH